MNDIVDQPAPAAQEAGSAGPAPTEPAARLAARPPFAGWKNPWLFVALIALGLAGWQWVETRTRLAETQQVLAQRLAESDTVAKESRALSKQAQEQFAVVQGKLGELEGKIAESQSQQAMLERLYQDMARSRDEWALAEVEQSVAQAAQQLQFAGNVQGAVLALQTADARLAGNNRPQFISLRKVLSRDLDRLRALPQADISGMSSRIESLIAAVATLPLAIDGHPRAEVKARDEPSTLSAALGTQAFWKQLALEFWDELRGLVRIQRFDRDEPALLAPGQDFFLRENLKLRLLNARLAMLSHDQWIFRSELKQAHSWIGSYFDTGDKSVQTALGSLKQLSSTEIGGELPNVNESLSAVRNFKLGKERQ